jgi:hypothetical protein
VSARFRKRELQPFSSRRRYFAFATSSVGHETPFTTITLKKASGFQIGAMSEFGAKSMSRTPAPGNWGGCPGTFRPSKKARLSG